MIVSSIAKSQFLHLSAQVVQFYHRMNNPGEYPDENQENEVDDADEALLPAAPAGFLNKPVRVAGRSARVPPSA